MKKLFSIGCGVLVLAAAPAWAQERVTIPFRDPAMPKKLVVDGMVGNVTVTGYNGQEVVVEATGGNSRAFRQRESKNPPPGLRRIGGVNAGLDITEENNTVHVRSGMYLAGADLKIQVPQQTSVSVKTMGGKGIRIESVNGEIEANNTSGEVAIVNVGGSVVAHSMNGKLVVSLNNVTTDKPMSFSTMNGDIDVSLPAAAKAKVKMKTNRGAMYTDFDVQLDPTAAPVVEDNRKKGGTYRVRIDSSVNGTINGGGPEFQFTTMNGDIMLRKK